VEYISIHKRLFTGIYKFAGIIRDYDISKSEWVLNGETVLYASALNLRETLEYDFKEEKQFDYKGLSQDQIIEHLARFIAYVWQIHIFGEGNTRTTAVFLIKYLRHLGFKDTGNVLFAEHSWYFRNALVRANYEDITRGIHKTNKYLIRFLSNLLLKEKNSLKNRDLHISFSGLANAGVNTPNKLGVNDVEKLGVKLNNNQIKILDLIEANNRTTIIEIAKSILISETAVENNIKKLREKGILSRVGSDKTGHWQIG
jgi:fido (protein-threonine AMPylation protein)